MLQMSKSFTKDRVSPDRQPNDPFFNPSGRKFNTNEQ
jgi:hypothetical protein